MKRDEKRVNEPPSSRVNFNRNFSINSSIKMSGLGAFYNFIKSAQKQSNTGTRRYFMLPKYSEFVIQ